MTIFNIFVAIFAFGFIVFFHELFHFLAARMVGVEPKEFSVGFGKSIFAIQNKKFYLFPKKDTFDLEKISYHVKMLPLGGYVLFERPVENEKGEMVIKGEYEKVHPLKRIFIAIAGPIGNLLLGFVLMLTFLFPYMEVSGDGKIIAVGEDSIAESIGIQKEDRILSLNGIEIGEIENINDYVEKQEKICLSWETTDKNVLTECVTTNGELLGLAFSFTFTGWLNASTDVYKNLIVNYVGSLYEVILNIDITELSGPVGTVDVIQQSVPEWEQFLSIMIIVNIALALVNLLLPLSITDGGKIVVDLICFVRRKQSINTTFVDLVSVGLMVLLFITTFYLDISRIIEKIF